MDAAHRDEMSGVSIPGFSARSLVCMLPVSAPVGHLGCLPFPFFVCWRVYLRM